MKNGDIYKCLCGSYYHNTCHKINKTNYCRECDGHKIIKLSKNTRGKEEFNFKDFDKKKNKEILH